MEDDDAVGHLGRLEAVGDDDRGPVARDLLHGGRHAGLGGQVEIRGGFVERRMTGSTSSARARAISWRCPEESDRPRSDSSCRYPPGSSAMKSWAPTARAAASTSSSPAPGRP
jgi:hypothetical protein